MHRWILAAAICTLGCSTGAAFASPVIFNPSASNNQGIISPGLVLDAAVSSVDATGGGLGNLYQDLNINANGSYNTQILMNITSFTNTANAVSQLGTGWQLFAVIAAQGTGVCTPSCGVGTGSWAATSANIFVQLYGAKGTPLTFPVNGRTGISNGTGSGLNTAATNNASLTGGQMRNGYLNPSSNAQLEFTEPNGAIGGFAGAGLGHTNGGANTPACIDTATNNAAISPFANCILLPGSAALVALAIMGARAPLAPFGSTDFWSTSPNPRISRPHRRPRGPSWVAGGG